MDCFFKKYPIHLSKTWKKLFRIVQLFVLIALRVQRLWIKRHLAKVKVHMKYVFTQLFYYREVRSYHIQMRFYQCLRNVAYK